MIQATEWTLERIREAYDKVANDEIGRLGTVQKNQRKSTDFLRRVIAPVDGMGGVTFVVCLPTLQQFSLWRTTFGRYRRGTETATTET